MKYLNYEVEILVNGKPITEYHHNSQVYVEGRKNTDYSLRIKNTGYQKIVAVTSVDGLNVMTGEPAGSDDAGYIIAAYGEVVIPGWKLNGKEAAKFVFSGKDNSYSVQSGQGENNLGIIGVKVFQEQPAYVPVYQPFIVANRPHYDDGLRWRGVYGGATSPSYGGHGLLKAQGVPLGGCGLGMSSFSSNSTASASTAQPFAGEAFATAYSAMEQDSSIGTGFGKATAFETTTVSFNRQSYPAATLLIRYDTRKNLEHLGIKFEKPKKAKKKLKAKPEPQAFPADTGCRPPKGWQRG